VELIRNQNELIQLVKCAGMELGKWVSNSSRVADRSLATIGVQDKGYNSTAKVLGIHWNPEEDMFSYKVCLTTNPHNTKRQVLSDVVSGSAVLKSVPRIVATRSRLGHGASFENCGLVE